MKAKQLLIPFIISLTLFAGCGGEEGVPRQDLKYETDEYEIVIPQGWERLSKQDLTQDIPVSIDVAFRNNIKSDQFTANLNVSKHTLSSPVSALEYATNLINAHKSNLLNFEEHSREKVNIEIAGIPSPTYFITFSGKKDPASNIFRFYQIFAAKSNNAYVVTATTAQNEDQGVINKVIASLKSFKVK